MVGVPTHWRELNGDAVSDPELLKIISKADIVSPWTVGRYANLDGAKTYADTMLEADATRRRELATLARLQEKYGARPPPPDPEPIGSQADKADTLDDTLGRQAILPLDPDRADAI